MAEPQLQTPVVLMIFNRPDTTVRVFEAIRAARPSRLLVVADGPRPDRPGEAEQCAVARAVIDRVDWDCEILTNFADTNLGCKRRISSGLDWVFSIVEGAIILEDDCVPHLDFFPFCTALLDKYRDDERVMMIGGTNYLLAWETAASYVFSRYFAIWGWATWRRAWQLYDLHMTHWETFKAEERLRYFYPQSYMRRHVTTMFDLANQQHLDTWDVQWFFSCLFNNGLSAVPHVNLISNIGHIGTHGTGYSKTNDLPVGTLGHTPLIHPALVCPDLKFDSALFERHFKPGARAMTRALLKRIVRG